MTELLRGIVGSHAYGLATEDSDVDQLGIFALPTSWFVGVHPPTEKGLTVVQTNPDVTMHEVGKFLRLALKCNPTITELLWLDKHTFVRTPLVGELLSLRSKFLSRRLVKDAYLGYATQQFEKLQRRGFGNGMDKRAEKHARHLKRLLEQGAELYRTGQMTVEVSQPWTYFDFGREAVADPTIAQDELRFFETVFQGPARVPEKPDLAPIEAWLQRIRKEYP